MIGGAPGVLVVQGLQVRDEERLPVHAGARRSGLWRRKGAAGRGTRARHGACSPAGMHLALPAARTLSTSMWTTDV